MLAKSLFVKLFLLSVSVIFLSQCTKIVENNTPVNHVGPSSPYTMPAAAYLAMANNQTDGERQNMLIMAAGRYLYDGQWKEASNILAQTDAVSVLQSDEKNILLAKIDMMREQPRAAITKLSAVHEQNQLPVFYQTQFHETLASAYESAGNATYGINERIKLDHLLTNDPGRSSNNRRVLWLTLTKLPAEELNTMAVEARDGSALQGWLKLALIARQNAGKDLMISKVEQWQQQYPQHPANSLLPSPLASVKPYLHSKPRNMALLVPLSGPLAGPGGAVRDGFMAAFNSSTSAHDTHVRLYDTAAGNVENLYQQALAEGADYVVGPLTKNDVVKVAALDHPVPTLFLNDMDAGSSNNAYRFGLSPANEARQVAAKAGKNGLKKALIITPEGAWGDEIIESFNAQWQTTGGIVVEKLTYNNETDLNKAVRDFLHVSEKQAQEKQFKAGSEEAIQTGSQRREDFDMIFLLAYPTKARQIMPLLKYYFAGDIPVYATSSVYAGSTNTMRDRDLDGITFCDMPWVFNHQLTNKNWPEQFNSYSRLYALGMDSYSLSTQLNQLILFPAMGVNDKSGVLYLNRAQQVARVLAWGKFKGGVALQTSETI